MFEKLMTVQTEYAQCIDDDRLEEWPDFFSTNCYYRITTAENYRKGMSGSLMFADSKGMLSDRVTALRQANIYEKHSYRHILSAPVIYSSAQDEIKSRTSFFVARIMHTGEMVLFATGFYQDVYRHDRGELHIARREVICDSNRIDTLIAIPI